MPIIHSYDNHGVFAGSTDIPDRPKGLSLPVNCTLTAPPDLPSGRAAVWSGSVWTIVEDHHGRSGYVNGEPRTINSLGPLPEGWSDAPPPPTLDEARAAKLTAIDAETSVSILAGFDYEVGGETLHFSYKFADQQNFADTANAASAAKDGVPGLPQTVTWSGWKKNGNTFVLRRLDLTPDAFLDLYFQGALAHKAACMERGGQRKEALTAATTVEEIEAI